MASGSVASGFIDRTGHIFGRLTVVSRAESAIHKGRPKTRWLCRCECGAEVVVYGSNLTSGSAQSCGCLKLDIHRKRLTKHGQYGSPTYVTWCSIKNRCNNPKATDFEHYGGRGIRICDEWNESFEAFIAHVGERPSLGHTIERKDTNGHYEPGNVEWVLEHAQHFNQRSNHRLTYKGVTKTLEEWANERQISRTTIYSRLTKLGWSVERALETPARTRA